MNNTFSFKRFGYLLREIFVEKKIFYLGILLALIIYQSLFTNLFDVLILGMEYMNVRGFIIISSAIVGIMLITSILTKRFDKSAIGIRNFMLPVSPFEKWLSILVVIGTFLFFQSLLFKIVDAVILTTLRTEIKASSLNETQKLAQLADLTAYSMFGDIATANVIIVTFLASLILLGSTYFKKNKIAFTLISTVVILVLVFLLNWGINYFVFGIPSGLDQHTPFVSSEYEIVHKTLDIRNNVQLSNSDISQMILKVAYPLLALILFITYYFRLKETEI